MIGLDVNGAAVGNWTFGGSDGAFCAAKGFALNMGGEGDGFLAWFLKMNGEFAKLSFVFP